MVPPPANRPRLGSITANFASGTPRGCPPAEHLHAAGGAEAVDGAMIGFQIFALAGPARAVVEPVPVDLAQALVANALAQRRDRGNVGLEVRAGEERILDARDDRDPGVGVGIEALPRLAAT